MTKSHTYQDTIQQNKLRKYTHNHNALSVMQKTISFSSPRRQAHKAGAWQRQAGIYHLLSDLTTLPAVALTFFMTSKQLGREKETFHAAERCATAAARETPLSISWYDKCESEEYVCPPESRLSQGADNCSASRLLLVLFSFYVNSHHSKQRLQPEPRTISCFSLRI